MEISHLRIKYFIISVLLYSCTTPIDSINENEIFEIKSIKGNTKLATLALLDTKLLESNLSKSKIALIYFEKGKLLSILQKDREAVSNFKLALQSFQTLNSQDYIAEIYWHLGSCYAFLSEKVIATEYLLKALELNKTLNDYKLEANIYGSLAHIHYLYNDYDKSIDYTSKSIEIQIKNKDTLGLSATYNNIAVIYKNILQFDKAIEYNKKSLALNILLKEESAVAKSYNNLGQVFEKTRNYSKAISFYKKAITLNDSLKNVNTSAIRNLANLYLVKKETTKAKQLFLQALQIEYKNSRVTIQKNIYDKLLSIALQNKNFENSLIFQSKRDSLTNLNNKFENDEKIKSIEIQYQLANQKNELKKEKQQNKIAKIILGIIFILLIGITLLLVQFFNNRKLKNEKDRIKLEQRILRSQMNPHFIFNALSAIQNSLLDNEPIKSASYLSRFAKLIRQNFDFINEKTISLKDELDALQNYIETQQLRFKDKFDYEINIHSNVDINTVEIPPLLLQPFVENAIEHGFKNNPKKGKIAITILKKEDSVCYEISDNGKGFSVIKEDTKTHALDIFKKRLQLIGNNDEKSFKIQSTEKGTTVKFALKQ